jgi:predicted transposase/invertase (TIGR01784 family)
MKIDKNLMKELDKQFSKNPHDAFVRSFLDKPRIAKDFLQTYLPKQIVEKLDFNSLKVEPGVFIEDSMKKYRTDLLYSIDLNGISANIYIVIEHKSYVDKNVAFQIFGYMSKIWERNKQNKEKKKRIIPLLFYYSEKDWNFKTNFFDHVEKEPKEVDCFVPNFEIAFFNLNKLEKIIGKAELQLLLMILKYKNDIERIKQVEKLILINGLSENYFMYIGYYLNYTSSGEDYTNFINKINNTRIGGNMVSIMEYKEQKGRQEGEQIGMQKGEFRKQIEMAKRMLRFGEDIKKIALFTGLSIERIKRLQ